MLEALLRLILSGPRALFVAQEAVVAGLVGLEVGVLFAPGEDLASHCLVEGRVQRLVLAVLAGPGESLLKLSLEAPRFELDRSLARG